MSSFSKLLQDHRLFGVDTNILIYAFEQNPTYKELALELFKHVRDDKIQLVTSAVTLGELLVKPLKNNSFVDVERYKNVVNSFPNLISLPIHTEVAIMASQLRAKHNIYLLDAFQIAAALFVNAEVFITNDVKLKRVDEIKVVSLQDFV